MDRVTWQKRSFPQGLERSGPVLLTVALVIVLLVVRYVSAGIPDAGDGVMHYQYARFFWKHAYVALAQWGKPVFSLLASPFAWLGLWGMALFAGLCAFASSLVIMDVLKGDGYRTWRWAVPVFLLMTPIYVHTVVAGLTEPLFGLFTVLIVHAMLRERNALAMLLVSLLPFVRPEYVAFAPFPVAVVVWRKDLKALPWLVSGVVLYSLCSAVLLGQPFAFFTDHTYMGRDLYGNGDPLLFVDNIDSMFGVPIKRLLGLAVLLFIALLWADPAARRRHLLIGFLALLPAVAIFGLHCYAWWRGGLGSMGLLRVIATVVPLLILFVTHVLAGAWVRWMPVGRWRPWAFTAILLFLANVGYHELRRRQQLPVPQEETQRLKRDAADHVIARHKPGERLVHADPLIGLLCGVDPWDNSGALYMASVRVQSGEEALRPGDRVVWDAQFAAGEGDVALEELLADERLVEEAVFRPVEPITSMGGRPYAIHVFRCVGPS
ncbi:MAG: hypothetical protein KF797_11040 [Flavobacteriales bacterium]|nr:hypothetical protein [Flavobacteriales bacterium]